MPKKDLEVKCPDCGSNLRLDRETGEVIAHGREERPKDLGEVAARLEQRQAAREDAFGAALEAEKGRAQELDDLFKKAADKAKKAPEDGDKPDNPLDDRWR